MAQGSERSSSSQDMAFEPKGVTKMKWMMAILASRSDDNVDGRCGTVGHRDEPDKKP
jgi:hypothetical protein